MGDDWPRRWAFLSWGLFPWTLELAWRVTMVSFVDNFPDSPASQAIKQVVRSVGQLIGEDPDQVLPEDMVE